LAAPQKGRATLAGARVAYVLRRLGGWQFLTPKTAGVEDLDLIWKE